MYDNSSILKLELQNIDKFQLSVLQNNLIAGVFKLQSQNDEIFVDTLGYISIGKFLSQHTLNVSVFKSIVENFLSILSDSSMYYLDNKNFLIESDKIFICLDDYELKMIYQPCGIEGYNADCIREFLFDIILPNAKFTKDENWDFVIYAITYINSLDKQNISIDVLDKLFAGDIDLKVYKNEDEDKSMSEEITKTDTPHKKSKKTLDTQKKIRSLYQRFIKKSEKTVVQDTCVNETTLLKNIKNSGTLESVQTEYSDIVLYKNNLIIGRNSELADAVITSMNIGKIHAEIILEGEKVYIRDLNSLNGTYINDARVQVYSLVEIKNGDKLMFADIEYRVNL